ncbi:hypothetical protein [Thiothrix nivea]|uniref:LTXXQ motif family protein n=1 Tax=Thiothrix nivea (strain ATCC 35100 / DSM 5205 / JP2) TaxID=870187 RepID=A0A656HBT5_THINJ|nr:hypothetical protein [Thiothrix nivea]EIJ33622.1 hypothetical protein Thini_0997 [Thiothrix nivea DSM 5205]
MKPVLLMSVLAGVLMSATIAAQDEIPPPAPAGQTERMQNELGLTDSQVSQINSIEAAQREKMQALHDDFQTKINSILSAEQAAQLEQMQAQHQPPGNGGMAGGQRPPPPGNAGMSGGQRPPPPPTGDKGTGMGGQPPEAGGMAERMQNELGLTDEQAAQLAPLQQQQRTQMDALRTETRQLIKQVLTAEQTTAFEQMQPPQPPRGMPGNPPIQ